MYKKFNNFISTIRSIVNDKRRSPANGSNTSSVGGVTSLILLGAVMCGIVLQCNTSDTSAATINMSVDPSSLTMNVSPRSVHGTFVSSGDINVSVTATGTGGYTLGIKSITAGTNSTSLVSASGGVINSIASAVSLNDFSADTVAGESYNNQWGYKPSKYLSNDNTNYLPAPDNAGDILDTKTDTDASGNYTISIGARVSPETPIGAYSNTFRIIAITNTICRPFADNIDDAVCMQDINDNIINSMVVGQQYVLKDDRDGKDYYIAKMADGRVWMTQNLDLDLSTTVSLTSENTDLNTFGSQGYTTANGYACSNASTTTNCTANNEIITWTPANATTTSGWTSSNNVPYSYDNGNKYYYTDTSGNTTTYNDTATCTSAHDDGTCPHYHSGNYYNFSAAVASNNTSSATSNYTNMSNSICPAGWRLPTGRISTTSTNTGYYADMDYLWRAEGIESTLVSSLDHYGTYAVSNATGYLNLSNSPLYMVRSGYRSSNSAPSGIGSGYYRTGTVAESSYAYTSYFNANYPYPLTRYGGVWATRAFQIPVRCVARQSSNGGTTTITFDKNNIAATGEMEPQTINANDSATLAINAYTLTNYTFTGWNTKSDGTGVSYKDAATYYAAVGTIQNNVTLYAQWVVGHTITVQGANGVNVSVDNGTTWTDWTSADTNTTSIIAGEGQTIILMAQDNTSGYAFNGWTNTTANGSFTNTAWRSTNTKTTAFTVGAGDTTITATGTDTGFKTIADSKVKGAETGTVLEMQDITSCPDWLATGTVYELADWRGIDKSQEGATPEIYYVTKLNDGKCWMLDNLRLGSNSSTTTITNEDSNISAASYELPQGITSGFSSYSKQINAAYKDTVSSKTYGAGSGKIGTYYNYCAASAGKVCTSNDVINTNQIPDTDIDICPKNWRMPTGGSINLEKGYGEYRNLNNIYTNTTATNTSSFQYNLSTPLSGNFNGSTQYREGSYGYFWSSTFYGGYRSYYLGVYSTGVYPSDGDSRYNGFSVRCLLRD